MIRTILIFTFFSLFTLAISAQVTWVELSPGGEFTVGLADNGDVYTWGFNGSGQLGNGSYGNKDVLKPEKIMDTIPCIKVSAGNYHALALAQDSTLWAWGYNGYGQVMPSSSAIVIPTPTQIDTSHKWVDIYAGFNISYAVDTSGNLYVWGSNVHGEAGINSTEYAVREMTKVVNGDRFKQISCGKYFTIAVDYNGNIWGWGDNSMMTLTSRYDEKELAPVLIDSTRIYDKVATSFNSAHALDIKGHIFSWGSNLYRESGVKDAPEIIDTLMQVGKDAVQDYFFTDITCGGIQCFATEGASDDLYTWGTNNLWRFITGASYSDTAIIATIDPNSYQLPMASKGLDDGLNIFSGHILFFENGSDQTTYCGVGPNYVGQLGAGFDRTKVLNITCNLGRTVRNKYITLQEVGLYLYPNPARNRVYLNGKGKILSEVRIYNLQGQEILHQEMDSEKAYLSLIGVNPGVYIIHTLFNSGQYNITKLNVQ